MLLWGFSITDSLTIRNGIFLENDFSCNLRWIYRILSILKILDFCSEWILDTSVAINKTILVVNGSCFEFELNNLLLFLNICIAFVNLLTVECILQIAAPHWVIVLLLIFFVLKCCHLYHALYPEQFFSTYNYLSSIVLLSGLIDCLFGKFSWKQLIYATISPDYVSTTVSMGKSASSISLVLLAVTPVKRLDSACFLSKDLKASTIDFAKSESLYRVSLNHCLLLVFEVEVQMEGGDLVPDRLHWSRWLHNNAKIINNSKPFLINSKIQIPNEFKWEFNKV